jgi:hypothetical protein
MYSQETQRSSFIRDSSIEMIRKLGEEPEGTEATKREGGGAESEDSEVENTSVLSDTFQHSSEI